MKSACTLLIMAVFTMLGFGQDHPPVPSSTNTIYVAADGKYEAAPDTAQIQFNVSVQEDTAQAAFQRASKEVEQVREVLRANAIDPKAANIGFFSVQPMYDWKNPKQKVIAYRVTTDVTLKLKDFSKIAPLTQQLADANVSESQTLSYTLENMDEAKSKAVEDAYRRARHSAETLARVSGRTLGEMSSAGIDTWENQRPIVPRMARAMALNAAAPAPTEEFSPQNVTVGAHVNVLFNLK